MIIAEIYLLLFSTYGNYHVWVFWFGVGFFFLSVNMMDYIDLLLNVKPTFNS